MAMVSNFIYGALTCGIFGGSSVLKTFWVSPLAGLPGLLMQLYNQRPAEWLSLFVKQIVPPTAGVFATSLLAERIQDNYASADEA
ncbi:MAG: hypothetical protein V3V61_04445, partial [Gammaproteobacteria bacterium]